MSHFFDSQEYKQVYAQVVSFISDYMESRREDISAYSYTLFDSMNYSLSGGGKKFRPVLSLMMGDSLGVERSRVLPWACAIEFVHTYSLIHDDLPCMDNDDFRRGQPTNHRKFGEDIALLAGDALLTESFTLLSSSYSTDTALSKLVRCLSLAAGSSGMVGGQVVDMQSQLKKGDTAHLNKMHLAKTGALIASAAMGPALLLNFEGDESKKIYRWGELLGLAFQIQDDILDGQSEDPKSYLYHMGQEKSERALVDIEKEAESLLSDRQKTMMKFFKANAARKH